MSSPAAATRLRFPAACSMPTKSSICATRRWRRGRCTKRPTPGPISRRRSRFRDRRRRLQIPLHGQGRRLGQQELPLSRDQGGPQSAVAPHLRRSEAAQPRHRCVPALSPSDRHRRYQRRADPQDREARIGSLPRHAAARGQRARERFPATSSSRRRSSRSRRPPASAPSSAGSISATTCG